MNGNRDSVGLEFRIRVKAQNLGSSTRVCVGCTINNEGRVSMTMN